MGGRSVARGQTKLAAPTGRKALRWPRSWRPDPAIPLLALLPLLVFAAQATGRAVFVGHDIQYYFYPYHAAAAEMIAQGHPPLWNPYAFSGFPLLGDGQTALFSPPNWLFLLPWLSPAVALNWAILLQFSIAALGTYGFARAVGLGRVAACVAAVAYAFGGFMTARVIHLSILAGAALLPVVLLGIEQALRPGPRQRRWAAVAAVAVAFQLVSGHPQVPVYTMLAVGLLVLVRAIGRASATGSGWPLATLPLRAGGSYLLGGALAAIQLFPWFELARLSPRAAGASFAFVFERSKVGADWLLLLFPYLFGALRAGMYGDAPGIGTGVRIWEQSAYVGILTLALAVVGLAGLFVGQLRAPQRIDGWRGTLTCLALLLCAGVLLAAGANTPIAEYTYATPVLGRLRDVERSVVLASFALALLAGCGLQRLIDAGAATFEGGWRAGLVTLAIVIVAVPLGVVWLAAQPALSPELIDRGITPDDLRLLRLDRVNALVPLLLAFASAEALLAWGVVRPTATARRWLTIAAAALVCFDLALFAASFHATTASATRERVSPVAAFLKQDPGLFRTATYLTNNDLDDRASQDRLAVSWAMAYGIQDINGFNSLQPRRYTDYVFGPDKADVSYGYLRDQRLLTDSSPILSALNVKYLIVPRDAAPQPSLGTAFRPVWEDNAVRVYQNDRAYPRAYFAARVFDEPDDTATLSAVTAPGFDGQRAALIAGANALGVSNAPLVANETVAFTRYAPDRLTLRATTAAPRLLVLSEMDFPGWHATIDGKAVPIQRTNYLFRGIVVPPGAHTVELVYRPASVRWGMIVSALALVVAGLAVVTSPRAPTHRSGSPRRALRPGTR